MSLTVIIRGLPFAGKNSLAVDLAKRIKRKTQSKVSYKVLNVDRGTKLIKTPQERLDYITTVMDWSKVVKIPLFVISNSTGLNQVNSIIEHAERSMVISLVDDTVEHTPEDAALIKDIWEDHPNQLTLYRSSLDMNATMEKIMELYNLHDRHTN